jgi:hypothetical protein
MEPLVYWKKEKEVSPWIPIPATREAVIQAVKDGAMFTTWTIFEHEPGNNGAGEPVRHGDLVLDFDCKESPAAALQDMRVLCLQHLPEQFGVDPNAIRFYVSGGKGYHAVLPAWTFGHPEGHVRLPLKVDTGTAFAGLIEKPVSPDVLKDNVTPPKRNPFGSGKAAKGKWRPPEAEDLSQYRTKGLDDINY